jgi:hypothetical protein
LKFQSVFAAELVCLALRVTPHGIGTRPGLL